MINMDDFNALSKFESKKSSCKQAKDVRILCFCLHTCCIGISFNLLLFVVN